MKWEILCLQQLIRNGFGLQRRPSCKTAVNTKGKYKENIGWLWHLAKTYDKTYMWSKINMKNKYVYYIYYNKYKYLPIKFTENKPMWTNTGVETISKASR